MPRRVLPFLSNLSRLPETLVCLRETRQWCDITLAYLGAKKLQFPYRLHLRSGHVLTLHEKTDVVIFWLVFVRSHYPVKATDGVILDIGANIGIFTIYAARQAASSRIVAVEPFPDSCQRLRQHIKENRLADRVTVINCAVAREAGRAEMDSVDGIPSQYRRIDAADTASLNKKHRGLTALRSTRGVAVEKKTLGEIVDSIDGGIDLVKMNIHGSEYSVLMNTPSPVLRRLRRIAVQYHEFPAAANIGKAQLFSFMTDSGFRVMRDRDTRRGAGLAELALSA